MGVRGDGTLRVMGAGPAGLAAATTLARSGRKVVVFERRSRCGGRFNLDFQGIESWSRPRDALEELRSWGLVAGELFVQPFAVTDFWGPGRRKHVARGGGPAVYVVRRGVEADCLDQALLRAALEAGVEVRFDSPIAPHECDIAAPGPRWPTGFVHGRHFVTRGEARCAIFLGHRSAPSGYAYFISAGARGVIAVTILERGHDHRACLALAEREVRELYPDLLVEPGEEYGGFGQFGMPSDYRRDGALWAGEAAGLQDALWGFGIRTAIVSGRLAALALLGGRDYPEAIEEDVLPWVRASLMNRWLSDRFGAVAHAGIIQAWAVHQALSGDGRKFLAAMYGRRTSPVFAWMQRAGEAMLRDAPGLRHLPLRRRP